MIQGVGHVERKEELKNPTMTSCEEHAMYRRKKFGGFSRKRGMI